jgi:hypothetical protein
MAGAVESQDGRPLKDRNAGLIEKGTLRGHDKNKWPMTDTMDSNIKAAGRKKKINTERNAWKNKMLER